MKTIQYSFAALALIAAALAASCQLFEDEEQKDEPPARGLAVTNIAEGYNGYYVLALGMPSGFSLVGAAAYQAADSCFKAVKVAGGKVSLPVWKLAAGGTVPAEYAGSDSCRFTLGFFDTETVATKDMENYLAQDSVYIRFENGSAVYSERVTPQPRW